MTNAQDRNIGSFGKKPARIAIRGILAAAALTLAACGGGEDEEQVVVFESPTAPPTGCPNVSVLAGTETVTQFRSGAAASSSNVVARGLIGDYVGECTYSEFGVTVALDLPILGAIGPANTSQTAAYEYFVAVLSPTNRLLGKEVFVTAVTFDETGNGTILEELEQVIPLPDGAGSGNRYSILVGFQLSPQQLQYNRTL